MCLISFARVIVTISRSRGEAITRNWLVIGKLAIPTVKKWYLITVDDSLVPVVKSDHCSTAVLCRVVQVG
jgi:hypothetical protein